MVSVYFTSIKDFKIFHGFCPHFVCDSYRFLTHFNLCDMNKLCTTSNNYLKVSLVAAVTIFFLIPVLLAEKGILF